MTSPRGSYSGGYYTSPFFPDTPIYDSLVAERGTPQIAPIRVPAEYDTGRSNLPALPSALPALPPGPSAYNTPAQGTYTGGYNAPGYQQQAPMQQTPAPYIPQQATAGGRPAYNGGYPAQQPQAPYQGPAGYEAARPAAPRPQPPRPAAPGGYDDQQPYQRRNLGQGYYQG
ncbi:hypothetical protein OG607_39790 [Streptomyces sp. NBC_01537]|uniref:DUF6643 family protein n=1 Tax=Streptomyces sp. NBC_01537 TaxID=2903896 RepID=UPI0038671081